ncbi:MAG: hypothetical protein JW744_04965 [Candidatus Diapherotrites archaeon]|uniref:Uncharacterized protein n=1 Tax=Candidatus Iainarchaeum sp. TaxID=3101447 RepID=A0A938YP98_9ARCH|nr:hypothetical protein [Candidatus Diapherotrites archaeon]
MKFFEGFFALLAIAAGMLFAAFNFVLHQLLHASMVVGAAAIIALDIFAFLIWFVNWRYYPEGR